MDPSPVVQPRSGHYRLSCGEPCSLSSSDRFRRRGTVWNVSVCGAYVVLPGRLPLPPVGSPVLLTFALPGDPRPITCEARVQWHNRASIFGGCGTAKPALPAGCGLGFMRLEPGDAGRIAVRVTASRDLVRSDAPLRRATWTERFAGAAAAWRPR
jgi:hypothetical protein